ncbi:MAG TPA: DUF3299 domain-containing protein [Tepidisphaeraceae bacterium]
MTSRWTIAVLTLALAAGSLQAAAPSTQPAIDARDPRVELRANQAFNRGEYATALPLFQAVAGTLMDQPDRLGPVQEKIRVCQKGLASAQTAGAPATGVPAAPPDVPMDPETRHKHPTPKPGEVLEMTIKELGNFQYDDEKGGNLPADVKALNGAEIRLHGFMIPMDQADKITQFALVPSLFSCCFGQPPQIQHTIVVNCPKGKAVGYCPDEIIVQGKLTVQEKKDDGYVVSIFEVGAQSVKVAGK